ncbi:(Na+)-NQR maturation NqrM [Aliivibrio finisterrensis]|uniref:(Na+)-NQR maturation NqrM n=1 Tax=Aliivibrio finisterrensis TaxID=511998 RepID=A0A4Q5KJK5_9GAMM|nr:MULTISPECIES: (Na+)-NQR maturation NqrM [Aliivibrio]MDD9173955.1 (Na+)-NQR maturation NqrM [Aliivibrio sp. S3TY1]MDD9191032.1 (Na+)-NQR maturation NqrM [Aliivibrio sp. S2TY2]RYU46447.1 (Na+)-NQR maturation NqrM [Aliivibrio finisterrensis]
MSTVLITFGVFVLVILLMALGVIFGRKEIQGSCGGLNNVGVDKVCNCETTCDEHKLYQISEPSEK